MVDYFLGIDLGGTKILTAVADEEGNILAKIKLPTETHKGKDKVIDNIIVSIKAGQGIDNLLYITVSTGIGGGIIIDRKIYHGRRGG
ncbi:MAG: glucokinase [Halanaerobiales bacterium]|nr:glucokinase [Halanaerobiales bacterium]